MRRVLLVLLTCVLAWTPGKGRPWTPRDSGSCVWDVDPALTTIGTTLRASGTSPPAVTISGDLSNPVGVQVEVTTGATLVSGNMRFRVSCDNGATFAASSVTGVASYLTPCPFSKTLAFPAGTYTNDNVYKATAATVTDQNTGGTAKNLTQGTAALQPQFISAHAALGSRPVLLWPSVDGTVRLDTSTFTAVVVPVTYVIVGLSLNSNSSQVRAIIDHPNGAGDPNRTFIRTLSKTTLRAATATSVTPTLTGDLTSAFVLVVELNGNSSNMWLNGTQIGTNFTGASTSVTGWRLGGTTTNSQQWYGPIARVWVFSKVLSAADRIRIEHYASANYGGFSIAE